MTIIEYEPQKQVLTDLATKVVQYILSLSKITLKSISIASWSVQNSNKGLPNTEGTRKRSKTSEASYKNYLNQVLLVFKPLFVLYLGTTSIPFNSMNNMISKFRKKAGNKYKQGISFGYRFLYLFDYIALVIFAKIRVLTKPHIFICFTKFFLQVFSTVFFSHLKFYSH